MFPAVVKPSFTALEVGRGPPGSGPCFGYEHIFLFCDSDPLKVWRKVKPKPKTISQKATSI